MNDLLHNGIMIPNFIKTDTEGHDLEVVRSCGLHLSHIYAVRTEVHFEKAFKDGPSFSDIDGWFTDHDFFLLNIDYSGCGVPYTYFTPYPNRYGRLCSSEAVYLRNYEFLRSLPIAELLKVVIFLLNNYASDLALHLLLLICTDGISLCDQLLTSYVEQEFLLLAKTMENKPTEQFYKAKADYKAILNRYILDKHAFYPYLHDLC